MQVLQISKKDVDELHKLKILTADHDKLFDKELVPNNVILIPRINL